LLLLVLNSEFIMPLFLIFIIVPLIELMLLIEVGGVIGSGWTFAIIIATAIIGTKLVKQQGLQTWTKIQQEMATGQLPAQSLFDGICILISGVLLITPGLITDVIGMLLLTPPFRALAYTHMGSKIRFKAAAGFQQQNHSTFDGEFTDAEKTNTSDKHITDHQPTTLDGEFKRKD
jgi:UPF0716 protein FxsA